jgi:hypothetical protein
MSSDAINFSGSLTEAERGPTMRRNERENKRKRKRRAKERVNANAKKKGVFMCEECSGGKCMSVAFGESPPGPILKSENRLLRGERRCEKGKQCDRRDREKKRRRHCVST